MQTVNENHLTVQDRDQLRLLAIFHYVVGGLGMLFSLFPLVHVAMGLAMVTGTLDGPEAPPPGFDAFGWIFVAVGGVFVVLGETVSVCTIISGRYLNSRRHYYFSFVLACVMLLAVPFGTILGIFTIIVLSRPNVKYAYGFQPAEPPPIQRPLNPGPGQGPQGVA